MKDGRQAPGVLATRALMVPRCELSQMWENYDTASVLVAGPHDDAETVKKAAYWIGRNAVIIQRAAKMCGKQAELIVRPSPAFEKYERDAEAIYQQFAVRGEDGAFSLVDAGDGRQAYRFADGQEALAERELAVLREQCRETLVKRDEQLARLKEYLEACEEVLLFTIPYAMLPAMMSGSYQVAIMDMLNGLPDEDAGLPDESGEAGNCKIALDAAEPVSE
jgi:hypothetical protein